jgi:hypothetical protein
MESSKWGFIKDARTICRDIFPAYKPAPTDSYAGASFWLHGEANLFSQTGLWCKICNVQCLGSRGFPGTAAFGKYQVELNGTR